MSSHPFSKGGSVQAAQAGEKGHGPAGCPTVPVGRANDPSVVRPTVDRWPSVNGSDLTNRGDDGRTTPRPPLPLCLVEIKAVGVDIVVAADEQVVSVFGRGLTRP